MSAAILKQLAKIVAIIAACGFLLSLALFALTSHRLVGATIALVLLLLLLVPAARKQRALAGGAAIALVVSLALPFDISSRNLPGPPRFVPLVMGYLSAEGRAREARGEIVNGDCTVMGLEPTYVLVW